MSIYRMPPGRMAGTPPPPGWVGARVRLEARVRLGARVRVAARVRYAAPTKDGDLQTLDD
jgi:hypothetical protein